MWADPAPGAPSEGAGTVTGTRGAATAAAIEEAALDLVLERGYERVTVDLICEVAGVSQRTFFNHFPAKDDAVLGLEVPGIDEQAARRFIVGSGPLLQDALALVVLPQTGVGMRRMADRMTAISSVPSLLAGHLAQFAAVEDEVRELVELRLGRQDGEPDAGRRAQEAEMVASLVSGVMRWVMVASSRGTPAAPIPQVVEQARGILDRVVADSRSVAPASG